MGTEHGDRLNSYRSALFILPRVSLLDAKRPLALAHPDAKRPPSRQPPRREASSPRQPPRREASFLFGWNMADPSPICL